MRFFSCGEHLPTEPLDVDCPMLAEEPGTVTIRPHPSMNPNARHAVSPHGRALIRGIRFEDFDWAIDCAHSLGDIEELTIEDCVFANCNRVLNGWQNEQTMKRGPNIRYLTFRRCLVLGAKQCGVMVRNRFSGVVIEDNQFFDCHGPCIMVGNNFEKWQNEWWDAVIRRNTLVRTWAEDDAIGIQAYGVGHLIEHNTLMFNSTQKLGTAEGIYCKMLHGCVRNNLCLNAGGYEGQICLKGVSESEDGVKGGFNRIYGNEIHRTGRVPHRPHERAVMVRSDRETRVFENVHTGGSSVLIKSAAVSGGTIAEGNRDIA